MKTSLKYGRGEIEISFPDKNVIGVLEPSVHLPPITNLEEAVKGVLSKPTAGASLGDLIALKKPQSVAIIVNDMTRSTPSERVLPPILDTLESNGVAREAITIVIANGTHRAETEAEIESLLGKDIASTYRVENHLCDAPDLVDMGVTSTGNKVLINRTVAQADLRIAIGEVLLHYYAGFAGGRKSILPGVAGRDTTMRNHSMMVRPGVGIGILDGNCVYEETDEAVEKFCPLHFIVNLVSDSHKNIVRVVGGHFRDAWLEGVKTFREMNFVTIDAPADVVVVSAGGYPKDINMYQAHKAIYMASRAVKKSGAMLFFAELEEGYGHKVFAEWAESGRTTSEVIRDFEAEFRFGAHKLYYMASHARDFDMYLHSAVDEDMTKKMFCKKFSPPDIPSLLKGFEGKFGADYKILVIPQGGIVLPQVKGGVGVV